MPEYRTPGVYIEEVSGGPRPVQPSSTTDTGFIGVLTLPTSFVAGAGAADGIFLPASVEAPQVSWARALAFGPLAGPAAPEASTKSAPKTGAKDAKDTTSTPEPTASSSGNRLQDLVSKALPGEWSVRPPSGEDAIVLVSKVGDLLRVPINRNQVSVRTAASGAKEWEFAWGADEQRLVEIISGYATQVDIGHSGELDCVAPKGRPAKIDVDAIHDSLVQPAPVVHSIDGYHVWRMELGGKLFVQVLAEAQGISETRAQMRWDTLSPALKGAWDRWLRCHPGMRRLELALTGFFENGGASAYPAIIIQADGAGGPNKRQFLGQSYDGVSGVAMLAAPGLELAWQQAILEYAGPKGRGDLFAIMEAPRYLLTRAPRGTEVDDFRWIRGSSPYEVAQLQSVAFPDATELRFGGYSADEILDRAVPRDETGHGAAYGPWVVVDNPLSTGPHDRYVIAPPSGHVAGVIAHTDLKAGGGVHKAPANEQMAGVSELVTSVSDVEQGSLNVKGINIIRHRPGAGIRIWGARTTASDPLWTYVNVRRLFLFVERSVRDAVQWAVFLPNNAVTRRDLADTIGSFLYQLHNRQMLDGATWKESFKVQCDEENNPEADIRTGILTVDVEFKPVYPAEFIRIRFRQTPMQAPA